MRNTALASALLIGTLAAAAAAEPSRLDPQEPVRLDDQQLDWVVAGQTNGGLQGAAQWFIGTVGSLASALPTKTYVFLLGPQDPI